MGIEYAPAPAVAWGAEDRNPVIAMGTPIPGPSPTATVTPALQRPFENVGELGYAYNPITGNTLDFRTSGSSEAALLDFFTFNTTDNMATYHFRYPLRAGPVNINTRNSAVIAALLTGALPIWPPPGVVFVPAPRLPLPRSLRMRRARSQLVMTPVSPLVGRIWPAWQPPLAVRSAVTRSGKKQ